MIKSFTKSLAIFIIACGLTACGDKTKTETVIEEVIINTETIVEVEKKATKVSLEIFAGELPLQDDNCDRYFIGAKEDVCLYGIDLKITDISQLNSDRNSVEYTQELDGNMLNLELYSGSYIAEVNTYIYFDDEYVSFRNTFLLKVTEDSFHKEVHLIPYVNDSFVESRNILFELDTLLGHVSNERQWELFDLYKKSNLYVGSNYYPTAFAYGGGVSFNFSTFTIESKEIVSITVKSSADMYLNLNASNNAYADIYLNANEETEIFVALELFGTDWYYFNTSELFTEEDVIFDIISMKDTEDNIISVNQQFVSKYYEKGEIIKISSLENEQRFSFLGEGGENLQICVESESQPEYIMIHDTKYTENMSRSGNKYCFTNIAHWLYSYSTIISTDNNAEVVSISATGQQTGKELTWKKSED
jgi:hypothetical protein